MFSKDKSELIDESVNITANKHVLDIPHHAYLNVKFSSYLTPLNLAFSLRQTTQYLDLTVLFLTKGTATTRKRESLRHQ